MTILENIGWTDEDVAWIPPIDQARNMARHDRNLLAEMETGGADPEDIFEYQQLS